MTTQKKLLFPAFVASFIAPAVVFMVLATIREDGLRIWWGIALPIVLLVTLSHVVLLGLPSVLLLMRRGDLRFGALALVGFLIGALPSTFIALVRSAEIMRFELSHTLIAVLELGILGMVGGIAFFVVWSRQARY